MTKDNVVYQILLNEGVRMESLRKKGFDLFVKNDRGAFVPIAEAYDGYIEELKTFILKKKKTRYVITFTECFELLDKLSPAQNKILRFLVSQMNQGNIVENYSYRDINNMTGVHLLYVQKSLTALLEKDFIRFKKRKQGRVYMINPAYFFKGKMTWVFKAVRDYENFGKETVVGEKKDIFDL